MKKILVIISIVIISAAVLTAASMYFYYRQPKWNCHRSLVPQGDDGYHCHSYFTEDHKH